MAALTYSAVQGAPGDECFEMIARQSADRHVNASMTAWEFARVKLRWDPVYRTTLCAGLLPSGGTLIDIGCGQGLTLALLADARRTFERGGWPAHCAQPPVFDRMIGVEIRPRVADLARRALGADAEILEADASSLSAIKCRTVLLFDVLHLMRPEQQEAMLDPSVGSRWRRDDIREGSRRRRRLELLHRERGQSAQGDHHRTLASAVSLSHDGRLDGILRAARISVATRHQGQGTPFANFLFVLSARPHASAASHPPAQSG